MKEQAHFAHPFPAIHANMEETHITYMTHDMETLKTNPKGNVLYPLLVSMKTNFAKKLYATVIANIVEFILIFISDYAALRAKVEKAEADRHDADMALEDAMTKHSIAAHRADLEPTETNLRYLETAKLERDVAYSAYIAAEATLNKLMARCSFFERTDVSAIVIIKNHVPEMKNLPDFIWAAILECDKVPIVGTILDKLEPIHDAVNKAIRAEATYMSLTKPTKADLETYTATLDVVLTFNLYDIDDHSDVLLDDHRDVPHVAGAAHT